MSVYIFKQNLFLLGSVACLILSFCVKSWTQQSDTSTFPSQNKPAPAVQTDKVPTASIVFEHQMPSSIDHTSAAILHQVADTLNNDAKEYLVVVVGDTRGDPCDTEATERAASIKQFLVHKEGIAPERVRLMTTPAKETTAELHVVPQGFTFDSERVQSLEYRTIQCEVKPWRCVHSEAVKALASGKSLSDKESFDQLNHKCHLPPAGVHEEKVTYKDMLRESEGALIVRAGLVHVTVEASPENCNVRYRPVVGGQYLDSGMTTVAADIEPKYYVFNCACRVPISSMTIDCTTDRTIKFQCPKPKEGTSNKR